MLVWAARRSATLSRSTTQGNFATGRTSKSSSNYALTTSHASFASQLVTKTWLSSFQTRNYAKIVKKTLKTKVKKAKPTPVYDEDIEDENVLEAGDLSFEDASHEMKDDPELLKSSLQMEEILRATMPPEMVEQAIAEHRRIYAARRAGKMTEEVARRAGFVERLDPAKIIEDAQAASPAAASARTAVTSTVSPSSQTTVSNTLKPESKSKKVVKAGKSNKKVSRAEEDDEEDYEDDDDDYLDNYDDDMIDKAIAKSSKSKKSASALKAMRQRKKRIDNLLARMQEKLNLEEENDEEAEDAKQSSEANDELEERKNRIDELQEANKSNEPIDDEDLFHHRMNRLRGILSAKIDPDDEDSMPHMRSHTRKAIENYGFDLKTRKKPKKTGVSTLRDTAEDMSQLARRAKDLMAKGKWEEALEESRTMARITQSSPALSSFAAEAYTANQIDLAGVAAVEAFNIDENDQKANIFAARVFVAQHDPNRPDALKRMNLALHHIDRALETRSDSPELLSIKASIYMGMRKYKTASFYFKAALKEFDLQKMKRSLRYPTYRDYGKSLAGRGKYKSAKKYLELAEQLQPENIEILSLLAELFETGFQDIESAAPYYRKAVQLNPNDVPALVRLGQLFSDPQYSGHNLATARQCYERAMALQPLPDFWFPLGWLSVHLGENDKGIHCLQRAAELDPNTDNQWTALVLLAEVYAFDQDETTKDASLQRAIQLYSLALEERANADVQLNLAKCLLRAGRADEASALLHQIRRNDPTNCELKCVMVEALTMAGQLLEAQSLLDATIMAHPMELMPQFMKGKYLYEAGEFEEALPYLMRSVEPVFNPPSAEQMEAVLARLGDSIATTDPEIAAALQRSAEERRSAALLDAKKEQKSRDVDEEAEEEDVEKLATSGAAEMPIFAPEALYLLSRCQFEAEDWAGAKRTIAYALRFDEENGKLLEALAETHLHLGEQEEAMEALRRVSVLNRSAPRPSFRLGNLCAESEQYEQALTYYQRALDATTAHLKALEEGESNASARGAAEEVQMEAKRGASVPQRRNAEIRGKETSSHQQRNGTHNGGIEGREKGAGAENSDRKSGAAPTNDGTDLSREQAMEMLRAIYSNMSQCYQQLATQERSHYAKYTKLATQCAQRAAQLGG